MTNVWTAAIVAVVGFTVVSANANPIVDDFDTDSSADYECRNYGGGADESGKLSIDAGDNNVLQMDSGQVQFLHKTARLAVGETFQIDILTASGASGALGPVLQTAPPSSSGYQVRLRWNAGVWSPTFGIGWAGSFVDDDITTPAAGDTHWVERVSETQFTYYRGADLGSRVKVSDITFSSPVVGPGNVYVGVQAWSKAIQADNFAIVSPDGPAPPAGTATNTFQEGVDGYTGTADTYIGSLSPSSPTANYGSATKLLVWLNGSGDALVRFDGIFGAGAGQIPLGSTISSATLSLQTGNATWDGTDPDSWEEVYQLLQAFDENADTWNSSFGGDGVDTDDVEAASDFADRRTYLVVADDELVTFDVTSILQNWADGDANHGFVIKQSYDENKWYIDSSETATPARRPLLTVSYTGGAPATPGTLIYGK